MKKLFFVFIFFFSLVFQAQAQVLIPGSVFEYDFNQFDWSAFINEENIQKHIDFRNQSFKFFGPDSVITGLNLGKLDLVRLEQELRFYEQGLKAGLSSEEIQRAEEAIRLHRDNIFSIENTILDQGFKLGFSGSNVADPEIQAHLDIVKELYKGDHEVLFNMVEKTDKKLFSALGSNDEAYAKLILPQVDQYTKKMGDITQSYYDSLKSAYQDELPLGRDDVKILIDAYDDSFQIYKCFLKNFKNPVGEHQQALKVVIQEWYASQSFWGADSMIGAYKKGIESNPWVVASELHRFRPAPQEVRDMIAKFYRNDILNNEEFIKTEERRKLGARVDALIGLKYFGVINEEEQELFNKALEQGVIEAIGGASFFGYSRPIE